LGREPTGGGGLIAGKSFSAHYAVALLDISFDQVEIYLLAKPVACSSIQFAPTPYVQVIVDSNGAPIVVGKPSVQNGQAFVQANFYPATGNKYYAIQPGVSMTITRADPTTNGVWHGDVTVSKQQSDGKTFSYRGTFAAHWCGKD